MLSSNEQARVMPLLGALRHFCTLISYAASLIFFERPLPKPQVPLLRVQSHSLCGEHDYFCPQVLFTQIDPLADRLLHFCMTLVQNCLKQVKSGRKKSRGPFLPDLADFC